MPTNISPTRLVTIAIMVLLLPSCGKKPTEANSQAAAAGSAPVDYAARIGVAVKTASRICVQIRNRTVNPNSPVTIVVPESPQSFVEAKISGSAVTTCPITDQVNPDMASYDITLPEASNIPKMTALVAVLGTAAANSFALANVNVKADLDQTGKQNTFRACGANDGAHLTVWRGAPLSGTLLWSASYYEPGNPGTLPNCVGAEFVAPRA